MIDLDQCLVEQYDPYYKHHNGATGVLDSSHYVAHKSKFSGQQRNRPVVSGERVLGRLPQSYSRSHHHHIVPQPYQHSKLPQQQQQQKQQQQRQQQQTAPQEQQSSPFDSMSTLTTAPALATKSSLLKMSSTCTVASNADSKKKKKSHLSRDELARVCQLGEVTFEAYNGSSYMIAIRSQGDRKSLIGYRCDWNNCGYMNARVERMFGHIRSQHPEAPTVKKLVTTSGTITTSTVTVTTSSMSTCLTTTTSRQALRSSSISTHSSPSLSPRAFKTPVTSKTVTPTTCSSPSPTQSQSILSIGTHSPSSSISASPESSTLLTALRTPQQPPSSQPKSSMSSEEECHQASSQAPPHPQSSSSDIISYNYNHQTSYNPSMDTNPPDDELYHHSHGGPPNTNLLSHGVPSTASTSTPIMHESKSDSKLIDLLNGNTRRTDTPTITNSRPTTSTLPENTNSPRLVDELVDRNNNQMNNNLPNSGESVANRHHNHHETAMIDERKTPNTTSSVAGEASTPVPMMNTVTSNNHHVVHKENELGLLSDIESVLMNVTNEHHHQPPPPPSSSLPSQQSVDFQSKTEPYQQTTTGKPYKTNTQTKFGNYSFYPFPILNLPSNCTTLSQQMILTLANAAMQTA